MRHFQSKNLLLIPVLVLTSCQNFLDIESPTNIPVSTYYNTEADISAALTGAYGTLRARYSNYWAFTELPSDNTQTTGISDGTWGDFDKLSWRPDNANTTTIWREHYLTIASCNIVLDRIKLITFADEALKNRYAAEARFIRALMYFNLVRFFGNVPIVLEEITDEAQVSSFPQNTPEQVYTQIELDLADAIKYLPLSYPSVDVGRATKGAARSLLGKVYLQQRKWLPAADTLRRVILSGEYTLFPAANAADYTNLFSIANENGREIVFSIQYRRSAATEGEGSNFFVQFLPRNAGINDVGTTSEFNLGTADLFNSFEANDRRKAVAIVSAGSGNAIRYYTNKFRFVSTGGSLPPPLNEGENNWPLIRYSDVLLMYAEALNSNSYVAGGDAFKYLNDVRARAGLPLKTSINTPDQPSFQLAIERERRSELCFEGHRWHDLIRWNKAIPVMAAYKAAYPGPDPVGTDNRNMVIADHLTLYPIPVRERQIAGYNQNFGYN
jgi:starch-binding outer membrane protein, SusD/RagB family